MCLSVLIPLLGLWSAPRDENQRPLATVTNRLVALRQHACWGARVPSLGPSVTSSQRVVDGVHGHTPDGRANSEPATATCFPEFLQLEHRVRDHANCGHAIELDETLLFGGSLKQRIPRFRSLVH